MFIVAPHLIFLLSILGIGLANGSILLAVISSAAYGIGHYLTYRKDRSIRKSTETALAFVALGFSWFYSQLRGEHYLFSLQYWLMIMLILRSFRKMEKRDYSFCFLISAALFIHVGRSYNDLPFLFLTVANLVLAPYALFYFLAYYGGFQKSDRFQPAVRLRFSTNQFRFMSGVSMFLIITTILLFLIIPRPRSSAVLGAIVEDDRNRAMGFSDSVSLGSFNRILDRRDIVMTVETDKPALWRGTVFDYYEDGVWKETAKFHWRRPGQEPPSGQHEKSVAHRFEIFDVRLTNFELFSAGNIVWVKQFKDKWRMWINDLYSSVAITATGVTDFHGIYEVISQDTEFLGSGKLRPKRWQLPTQPARWISEEDLFLQLPADFSARIRNLALTLTRGMDTTQEKADAVQRYLAEGFSYSLKGLDSGAMKPLDYFLFKSKKGHCEYFASAMTILLRCAGVKARIVRGFIPGTYVDGKYVVRLCDAHLWTEVFYPEKGWKAYDPTPGRETRIRPEYLVGFIEKMQLKWQTYVLQYDGTMQSNVIDSLKRALVGNVKTIKKGLLLCKYLLLCAVVLCAFLAMIRFRRSLSLHIPTLWHFRGRKYGLNSVQNYFGKYLKEIARKGYKRHPGTTPNDLVVAMEQNSAPIVDDARFLTDLFYSIRFGMTELSRDNAGQIKRALARIRNWTR